MFDRLAQELEAIKDPKSNKDFYITKQEFEDFCKWFLFEEIKGNDKLVEEFCKKFGGDLLAFLADFALTL